MIIYSQLFVPTVSAYLKFDVYKFNQPWVVQYFSMYLLKKKSVYKWTRAVQTAMFKGQLFKQFSGICIRL